MSFNTEKRLADHRRQCEGEPPKHLPERRGGAERRQTIIKEISFFEWASRFACYQQSIAKDATKGLISLGERGHVDK